MQKGIYYRCQLKLIPLIVSIMGKKYFNRRCQGTIRIDQRRFEILLADTFQFAYTDRNVNVKNTKKNYKLC